MFEIGKIYKIKYDTEGITIISLVVTIIVLLILAGVSIGVIFNENGLFEKASKGASQYSKKQAEEILVMTLQEAQMKKYSDELTQIQLDTMLNKIGKVNESDKNIVTIDKYIFEIDRTVPKVVQYKGESDVVESGTGDSSGNIEDNTFPSVETIVLPANEMTIRFGAVGLSTTSEIDHFNYSISPVEGIPAEKVNGVFKSNEMVEITAAEENTYTIIITATDKNGKTTEIKNARKLAVITRKETIDEILKRYSAEEIANNNELLERVLQSPTTKSIEVLTTSQKAMAALGKNKTAKKMIMESDEWGKAIANSEYRKDFSEYIVYNANTLCATAKNREYYKTNDGIALTAIYHDSGIGTQEIFVSKNSDAVVGYCTYNINYREEIKTLEFEGEIWYYSTCPYGWNDGTTFSNIYYGKDIGKMSSNGWDGVKEGSIKLLELFFNE